MFHGMYWVEMSNCVLPLFSLKLWLAFHVQMLLFTCLCLLLCHMNRLSSGSSLYCVQFCWHTQQLGDVVDLYGSPLEGLDAKWCILKHHIFYKRSINLCAATFPIWPDDVKLSTQLRYFAAVPPHKNEIAVPRHWEAWTSLIWKIRKRWNVSCNQVP